MAAFPELTATRLTRELRERGYSGAYTALKRFVASIRPSDGPKPFEVRSETARGHQAQVNFAQFIVSFENELGISRIVWLSALVLGHSRHIFARFGLHQDLQTPFDALLKLERRVSRDGLVSIGGNYYSVPDRTRRVVGCISRRT